MTNSLPWFFAWFLPDKFDWEKVNGQTRNNLKAEHTICLSKHSCQNYHTDNCDKRDEYDYKLVFPLGMYKTSEIYCYCNIETLYINSKTKEGPEKGIIFFLRDQGHVMWNYVAMEPSLFIVIVSAVVRWVCLHKSCGCNVNSDCICPMSANSTQQVFFFRNFSEAERLYGLLDAQ